MPNILLNKRGCTIHCIRYFLADRIIASQGLNPCLTNSKFSLSSIFIYFVFLFRLANCQSINIPLPSASRANKWTIDRSAKKKKKKTYLKYLTNPFPLVTPRNNYLE